MVQYTYHYIKDMEFSGVFDGGFNHKNEKESIVYNKYFLFIKFRDLIYIEIKNVGSIIMPFDELLKNKYLKMYYVLSIRLIENKHKIIEKSGYNGGYNNSIYKEDRHWFIDGAYFAEDFTTKHKRVVTSKYYYYYNINPNNLRNMNVSDATDIAKFFEVLNIRYAYEQGRGFNNLVISYTNLMIDYNISLVEDSIEEIIANKEDNKNIINLLEFNNKKGMNADIFRILYNNIISREGKIMSGLYER